MSLYFVFKIMDNKTYINTLNDFNSIREYNVLHLKVRLVHWMGITTGIIIFITRNKMCYNVITKHIH